MAYELFVHVNNTPSYTRRSGAVDAGFVGAASCVLGKLRYRRSRDVSSEAPRPGSAGLDWDSVQQKQQFSADGVRAEVGATS